MSNATADSDIRKFSDYVFKPKIKNDKSGIFIGWGYTVEDSAWLKEEFIRQSLEKYTTGEYVLGKLDYNGQRVNIRIEIPDRNGNKIVSFITGWMAYPNGKIQLVTPYGGK